MQYLILPRLSSVQTTSLRFTILFCTNHTLLISNYNTSLQIRVFLFTNHIFLINNLGSLDTLQYRSLLSVTTEFLAVSEPYLSRSPNLYSSTIMQCYTWVEKKEEDCKGWEAQLR